MKLSDFPKPGIKKSRTEDSRLQHRAYVFHKARTGEMRMTTYSPSGEHKDVKSFVGWVMQNSRTELGDSLSGEQKMIAGTNASVLHFSNGTLFLVNRELDHIEQKMLTKLVGGN